MSAMSHLQPWRVSIEVKSANLWRSLKKAVKGGKSLFGVNSDEYTDDINVNRAESTSSSSSQFSLSQGHRRISQNKQKLYRETAIESPTSSITASSSHSHHQTETRDVTNVYTKLHSNSQHNQQQIPQAQDTFNDIGKLGNSQVKMKMILLDSLILRLKKFYGEEAEIICDQALFAAILDIKKSCTQRCVDLSIVDDIEIIYQQLIDNEAVFRLERSTKHEKEKWMQDRIDKETSWVQKVDLEVKKIDLHNKFIVIGVILVVGIFVFMIFIICWSVARFIFMHENRNIV